MWLSVVSAWSVFVLYYTTYLITAGIWLCLCRVNRVTLLLRRVIKNGCKPVDILRSRLSFPRAGTRCRPQATLEETQLKRAAKSATLCVTVGHPHNSQPRVCVHAARQGGSCDLRFVSSQFSWDTRRAQTVHSASCTVCHNNNTCVILCFGVKRCIRQCYFCFCLFLVLFYSWKYKNHYGNKMYFTVQSCYRQYPSYRRNILKWILYISVTVGVNIMVFQAPKKKREKSFHFATA